MSACSSQMQSCIIHSPAKINLFLEVIGRRADGFHELETVMARTSLHDTLQFIVRDTPTIDLKLAGVAGPVGQQCLRHRSGCVDFPLDESNLIVRAASALQQRTGCRSGIEIRVCKRIPGQAGLGGGSGNAAATLRALNRLWQLKLPMDALHSIAADLGSDVNFLLSGHRAAVCAGRGEQVRVVPVRGRRYGVLVMPNTGNSTAAVFRALTLSGERRSVSDVVRRLAAPDQCSVSSRCFNRLQEAAESLNPAIRESLAWLRHQTGEAHLTGSGSACFAPVRSAATAAALTRQFQAAHSCSATSIWW